MDVFYTHVFTVGPVTSPCKEPLSQQVTTRRTGSQHREPAIHRKVVPARPAVTNIYYSVWIGNIQHVQKVGGVNLLSNEPSRPTGSHFVSQSLMDRR